MKISKKIPFNVKYDEILESQIDCCETFAPWSGANVMMTHRAGKNNEALLRLKKQIFFLFFAKTNIHNFIDKSWCDKSK